MPADVMTVELFQASLPTQIKKSINIELIDKINATLSNPEEREIYRENLLSYGSVMTQGKFKINSYLDAVRYVGFKVMGDTNIMAYTRTFPDKIQRFQTTGVTSKDIASYVTAYNKSKLVMLIFEQSLIPTHILNADMHQAALNKQYQLMQGAVSEKVQMEAANSLLTHLKRPETHQIELQIGVKENSAIQDLRNAMLALGEKQVNQIQSGVMNAHDIAQSTLIVDGECTEVEEKCIETKEVYTHPKLFR